MTVRAFIGLTLVFALLLSGIALSQSENGAENSPQPSPDQQADQFLSQFGPNLRQISRANFLAHFQRQFDIMDPDGDGVLTRDEVVAFIKLQKETVSRVQGKMRRVQAIIQDNMENGRFDQMSRIFPIMQKVRESAQGGKPGEVEKYLDEILALSAK